MFHLFSSFFSLSLILFHFIIKNNLWFNSLNVFSGFIGKEIGSTEFCIIIAIASELGREHSSRTEKREKCFGMHNSQGSDVAGMQVTWSLTGGGQKFHSKFPSWKKNLFGKSRFR